MAESVEDLKIRIRDLEKEVAKWKSRCKDVRYGLNWLDVPEAFDSDAENRIPILEEAVEKAVEAEGPLSKTPPHVIIEGDNYHALTCLNYTHRGKVDVIYIDPPYNTGNDGFIYKDKRFLTKFPDGEKVPKEHPLRHSYWLSFMEKRLKLARNLLSDRGVIFISIDDNEQANLKLLCDRIFGEGNFIAKFDWRKKTGANDAKDIAVITESILLFAKNATKGIEEKIWARDKGSVNQERYKLEDEFVKTRGKYYLDNLDRGGLSYSDSMNFGIEMPDGEILFPNGRSEFKNDGWIWKWGKEKIKWGLENKFLVFSKSSKSKNSKYTIKYKVYQNVDNEGNVRVESGRAFSNLILEPINQQGDSEISDLFNRQKVFSNPKPTRLIQYLIKTLRFSSPTILDFFAGSGTTLHAVLNLNAEDGGTRQCILVQQNEGENRICENVTYERNRRVVCGYKNAKGETVEGTGGRIKYYRTEFVGKHASAGATDADKVELSDKAGCLIALAENTLESVPVQESAKGFWQIYSDNAKKFTCIYHNGDYDRVPDFTERICALRRENPVARFTVYVFSWNSPDFFENEFDDLKNIEIKAIPRPILEIYKALNG